MANARLLQYRTTTSPAPLQAGSPDKPAANTIDINVSSPIGQKVYCNKIDIAVPVSEPEDGGAYFTENPQVLTDNEKWHAASVQIKSGQELGLGGNTNYHHVVFRPGIPQFELIDKPLTISINGKLTTTTGSPLTCLFTETSGPSADKCTPKDTLELTLPTAEPIFYLHSFLAGDPNKPTAPKTNFNAGDDIYFTWESNGTYFELYDGDGTVLCAGDKTFCTVRKDKYQILKDTTFTLQASITSGTRQPATGFQPIYQYANLTITLNNPTLSDLTVGSPRTGNKLTTIGSSGLTVIGDLGVDGDLAVKGKASLASLFEEPIKIDPEITGDVANGWGATKYFDVEQDGLIYIQTLGEDGCHGQFALINRRGEYRTEDYILLQGVYNSFTIPSGRENGGKSLALIHISAPSTGFP
ncbi:hypothetical protein ACFQYP_17925 [Nonomuraea antimicrobica]